MSVDPQNDVIDLSLKKSALYPDEAKSQPVTWATLKEGMAIKLTDRDISGKLIAIDAVNMVKDYVQAKAHILSGAVLDQAQLADPARPLKEVELA